MTTKEKRARFMTGLEETMNSLDPTGANAKKYHDMLSHYTDQEFDQWVRDFYANPKGRLYLEIVEFSRNLTMEQIEKTAKKYRIPLYELVAFPYNTMDLDHIVVTPYPVPVGYIHAKRMPQSVLNKNHGSIHSSRRDPKTGQVIGEDKNARNSDIETYALVALGANKALKEFMGPRADNMKAKNQMMSLIAQNGFVSLDDLDNDPMEKTALNSLDVYFTMQGIRTNLVMSRNIIPGPRRGRATKIEPK